VFDFDGGVLVSVGHISVSVKRGVALGEVAHQSGGGARGFGRRCGGLAL
jgi:hypothetical protein